MPGESFFGGRARRVDWPAHADERGLLQSFALDELPFRPARVFTVACVPPGTLRGGHSHRAGQQLLVCLQGRVDVTMRFAGEEILLYLLPGEPALLFGPGVWCSQNYADSGTVLLVFASEPYSPDSYVGEWNRPGITEK